MATAGIPGLSEGYNNIQNGHLGGGDADGVRSFATLPFTREFRAVIESTEFKTSSTGNPMIKLVYKIEDDEYSDSKVFDNLSFTGLAFQGQRLAVLLASNGLPIPDDTSDLAAIAETLVGGRVVFALKEGLSPNYPSVRWLNVDAGQTLRMDLTPPASKTPKPDLDVKINIPEKVETPPAGTGVTPRPMVPGGIRLPNQA